MNFPPWALDPPLETMSVESEKTRYMIRYAALQHNRDGSIAQLADACGFSANSFIKAADRGVISAGMAAAIELVIGSDVVSKEQLCPDKFKTAA